MQTIRKNGQMEILGLAILFVIIIIAFLLFLKFSKPPQAQFEEYYTKTLPNDALIAFLGTSIECSLDSSGNYNRTYSMEEVIKDAYDETFGDNIFCYYYNEGFNSEDIVKEYGSSIINNTMSTFGRKYWFAIWTDEDLDSDTKLPLPEKFVDKYITYSQKDAKQICSVNNSFTMSKVQFTTNSGSDTLFVGIGICN